MCDNEHVQSNGSETEYLQLQWQLQYIMCYVVLKYMKCSVSVMQVWWSCNVYFLHIRFIDSEKWYSNE